MPCCFCKHFRGFRRHALGFLCTAKALQVLFGIPQRPTNPLAAKSVMNSMDGIPIHRMVEAHLPDGAEAGCAYWVCVYPPPPFAQAPQESGK